MAYLGAVSGSGGYPSLREQQHAQADMAAKESLIASASWYTELKALVKLADSVGSTAPYKAKVIAVLNGWKGE